MIRYYNPVPFFSQFSNPRVDEQGEERNANASSSSMTLGEEIWVIVKFKSVLTVFITTIFMSCAIHIHNFEITMIVERKNQECNI